MCSNLLRKKEMDILQDLQRTLTSDINHEWYTNMDILFHHPLFETHKEKTLSIVQDTEGSKKFPILVESDELEEDIFNYRFVKMIANSIWQKDIELVYDHPEFKQFREEAIRVVEKNIDGSKKNPICIC